MTISTIRIPDMLDGDGEIRIESTCVVGIDGEFEIESVELIDIDGAEESEYPRVMWAGLQTEVQNRVFGSGHLVRQIHDDCLNETRFLVE